MLIRPVEPHEYDAAGAMVEAAYRAIPGGVVPDDYAAQLRDVRRRAATAEVLVAVDDGDDGRRGDVVGCVTYVAGPDSEWAESDDADAAGMRMLAVRPDAQGRGIGPALVAACVERARRDGRARMRILSADSMTTAHRMYERLGWRRDPSSDWQVRPDVLLYGFVLDL